VWLGCVVGAGGVVGVSGVGGVGGVVGLEPCSAAGWLLAVMVEASVLNAHM